jgi:hypothetical protein
MGTPGCGAGNINGHMTLHLPWLPKGFNMRIIQHLVVVCDKSLSLNYLTPQSVASTSSLFIAKLLTDAQIADSRFIVSG